MTITRTQKILVIISAVLLAPLVIFWAGRRVFIILTIATFSGYSVFYPGMNKTFLEGMEHQPYDVIIVPGVPYDGKSWSDIMKIRVHWSNYLFKKGYTKNIIYSGSAVYTPYVEAKVMALYGQAFGIPTDNIFTEERAEHSTENVYYSYKIAKENGFSNIALATDIFQTNQLRSFIKDHNLDVKLLPIVFDTLALIDRYEPEINPSSAMVDTATFVSLTERESFFKRFRGTLGRNINFEEEGVKE